MCRSQSWEGRACIYLYIYLSLFIGHDLCEKEVEAFTLQCNLGNCVRQWMHHLTPTLWFSAKCRAPWLFNPCAFLGVWADILVWYMWQHFEPWGFKQQIPCLWIAWWNLPTNQRIPGKKWYQWKSVISMEFRNIAQQYRIFQESLIISVIAVPIGFSYLYSVYDIYVAKIVWGTKYNIQASLFLLLKLSG